MFFNPELAALLPQPRTGKRPFPAPGAIFGAYTIGLTVNIQTLFRIFFLHCHSAVNAKDLSCYVGGIIASQKRNGLGHVLC